MPTFTQEDYIRAIYRLSEDLDRPIKSAELVAKLDLNKSTISQRLKELQKHGWIKQEAYGPIQLTAEGLRLAKNLIYKHRLIELYLIKEMGFTPKEVHAEAHQLEHAVSDKLILKMAKKLGNPTHCPHGQELPDFVSNA